MNHSSNIKLFISKMAIVIAIMASLGSSYYFFHKVEQKQELDLREFDKARDAQFIRDAVARDKYWLVENPDFDFEFMMDTKSPNQYHPEYIGKLKIKVLFVDGKHAGFTTYYKTKFYEGKIQFIYVHPDYRNKGYAGKMVKYDMQKLFADGAHIIKMNTRVDNVPAIKSYERVGFKESGRDQKFIDLVISAPQNAA